MGYHVVDADDLDPTPDRPSETYDVGEAVGTNELGVRLYRVAPGEEIPRSGLHYHERQEEAFYVVAGRLRVETPEREYAVERGQFFVADPGSAHRAFNPRSNGDTAVVIGMGAPVDDAVYEYDR